MKKRILAISIILLITASLLLVNKSYEKNNIKLNFSNPPCYYYVNNLDNSSNLTSIRLYGNISTKNVRLYQNKDKTKFILINGLDNSTLQECVE